MRGSAHPLARAMLTRAKTSGIDYKPAENFSIIQGKGAVGIVNGEKYWIGSHRMIEEMGLEDSKFHKMAVNLEDAGHSLVAICNKEHICGLISVADTVREEAQGEAVRAIKSSGISRIVMLTGDNKRTACAVATAAGVDE